MPLYKLTNGDGQTYGGLQWGRGVTHSAAEGAPVLCTETVIHAYEHGPLLPVFLNPVHADFQRPRLWIAEGEVVVRDGPIKCGVKVLTTVREIEAPEVTTEQRVRFGILSAWEVTDDHQWKQWAHDWLSGEDRTEAAARAAWATDAAWAARAARAAAWTARATAWTAWAAARAVWAARAEQVAAEAAAAAAAGAMPLLDLESIANQAMDLSFMPELPAFGEGEL